MNHQMRAWIHCRVSQHGEKCLLAFQEKILKDFAGKMNLKIAGITKEISNGTNLESFECQAMINSICRKRVDIVLCVTPKRICVCDDLYEEFEMLCNMNEIAIMSMEHIHSLEHVLEDIL